MVRIVVTTTGGKNAKRIYSLEKGDGERVKFFELADYYSDQWLERDQDFARMVEKAYLEVIKATIKALTGSEPEIVDLTEQEETVVTTEVGGV